MKIQGFKDTIEWYNQNADAYISASAKTASFDEIDEFVELVKKHGKVLDAGCAGGRDTKILSDRHLEAVGLDISHSLILKAKERFPDLEFIEGSFLSIPFLDETFDGVWAHASLLHLENIEDVSKALSEFNRVMKKDAVIHVLVKKQTGTEKTAVVADKFSNHDRFFQYFTLEEIEDLMLRNQFQIIKSIEYNETDKNPNGRPEVEWILVLAKKL